MKNTGMSLQSDSLFSLPGFLYISAILDRLFWIVLDLWNENFPRV